MLVLDKNLKITELQKQIKDIDIKLDILDDKYSDIQECRKKQGLSLAIYRCSDPEALQLIQLDKETKELEQLQDQILQEKKKESSQQFHNKTCKLIKSYSNKKYKVEINNKVIAITDNFQEVIKDKKCTDKIKVSKLVCCNFSKWLPYECTIYTKQLQGKQICENRDYVSDKGEILDHQRYYNGNLWWREIYRGDGFYYGFNTVFNVEFIMLANIKGNYNFYIDLNKKYIRTYTNISIRQSVEGIPDTVEWQNKFNKLVKKYKKDKYLKDILQKIDELYV